MVPSRLLPLVLLTFGAALVADAGDKHPPVFSVGLDMVNLTVSVRDEQGRQVTDLERDDFTIFENGRPQAIQLFGRAHDPGQDDVLSLDLGMLFDTSESMQDQLRLTREAAIRFLDSVPRAHDLFTIFFDEDIRISRYDSENQQGLFERIADSQASGRTALYDAIGVYLSRVQDVGGRKVLLIFTDGEDSTSSITQAQVLDLVRSSSVTVYPVAFLGSFTPGTQRVVAAHSFLGRLAELSGGELFQPMSSKELGRTYDRILEDLEAQYVLGFSSDDAKHDGKFRKLRVEVKRKGLKVRHRPGYFEPLEATSASR
jgi:Ca-activated chloride channel family protein